MKKLLFIMLVFALAGCSNAREQLGLTRTSPDEFKVVKRAPLSMPPSYQLSEPRPGAARPQEQAPSEEARQAVLGKAAKGSESISEAEAALLQQTGADQADPEIRRIVDAESGEVDESQKPVAERLLGLGGFGGDPEGNVIDPKEEAERLQQAGQEPE